MHIKLFASSIFFVAFFSGCTSHKYPEHVVEPEYVWMDKALILVGEPRDIIRAEFGAPYCRNGDAWYYFDENTPSRTVAEIRFKDDHVLSYVEQGYDEDHYVILIPLLIGSLKDNDKEIRHRGYNFLRVLLKTHASINPIERPEMWGQIPLDSDDSERWQQWWLTIGEETYSGKTR